MAGKVATIVSLGLDKPFKDRPIAKALKCNLIRSDIRIQPIDGIHGYLIVGNRRKAQAEQDFMRILDAYKGFGGVEFDVDILTTDSPQPEMKGLSDDKVVFIESPKTPMLFNDAQWCLDHGIAPPSN